MKKEALSLLFVAGVLLLVYCTDFMGGYSPFTFIFLFVVWFAIFKIPWREHEKHVGR